MNDKSILHDRVRETLDTAGAEYEVLACEPHLADTAEFCAHYGISMDEACNAILVVLKTTPRRYVACLVRADTRLDMGATLSAGAPVFRFPTETVSTRDGIIFGRMDFGTIVLGRTPLVQDRQRRMTLPHEAIHVVQYEFLEQALSLPLERAILRKLGASEGFLRHVDLGAISVMLAGVLQMHMDYDDRPWERESVLLTEGRK